MGCHIDRLAVTVLRDIEEEKKAHTKKSQQCKGI
jgi:hypothetical protein